jgi:hypothetical protein
MKSILNDVNRLEKAWDLLVRLAKICNKFQYVESLKQANDIIEFHNALAITNAFPEKYENDR